MAVSNTKFKVTARTRREGGSSDHKDNLTQPRWLQPVAVSTDVTITNGFAPADLVPGDCLLVVDGALGTDPELWVRKSTNDGWSVFAMSAVNDQADVA